MSPKKVLFSCIACFLLALFFVPQADAFQYAPLPNDNLIKNPWFRSDCEYSGDFWNTFTNAPWSGSDKTQDPTDVNCKGNWFGFAARFADNQGQNPAFYPNQDAYLWQVVGPVSPNNKILSFHFLFVAHRVNQYKAEIYGGNTPNGPWTSVWVPLNIQNCLTNDCVNNSPPNGVCNQGNRECLWDEVTAYHLGSLSPLTKTIPNGFAYYKIEFLMNYPTPSNTATGDVGGKLVRVYFKTSGGGILPSTVPSPNASPFASTTPSFSPGTGITPAPSAISFTFADLKNALINIFSSEDHEYYPVEDKINMLDISYIIKYLFSSIPTPTPGPR